MFTSELLVLLLTILRTFGLSEEENLMLMYENSGQDKLNVNKKNKKKKKKAVVHRCSSNVPLKVCNFIKKRLQNWFSCEICEFFKNTFFHGTPAVAASEKLNLMYIWEKNLVSRQFTHARVATTKMFS